MTQNDHYLRATTEKWASKYKEQRTGKKSDGLSSAKHRATGTKWVVKFPHSCSSYKLLLVKNLHSFRLSIPVSLSSPSATDAGFAPLPSPSTGASASHPEQVAAALGLLAQLGYTGLTEEDLEKLCSADEYETEIMLMSGVRAYFQASTLR